MNTKQIPMFLAMFFGLSVPVALAQHEHGHGDAKGEHGKPAVFVMPTTYKGAVEEIQHRLHEIAELIESKQLDKVHGEAEVIQKVGNVIGQLALKDDSGVPKSAIKEINKAGRELAGKFDAIDKAGDSGDLPGTKKVYEEMRKLSATLEKYSPKLFACPMKCEGDKTYAQAGKCPKCGMALAEVKPHSDHDAKHGGVFFMAPDQKHHLEGAISDKGEFHIHFYDEYTKPILAEKFTAEGTVRAKGADKELPLRMTLEPGKSYLTGNVDNSIKFPLSIKMFIDFKDGQKPQVFDFDFDGPSKSPAGHDDETKGEHDGKGHSG